MSAGSLYKPGWVDFDGLREMTVEPVPRMKAVFVTVIRVLASLALAFLVIEIGARILMADPILELYRSSSTLAQRWPDAPLGQNAFYESLATFATADRPPQPPYRLDEKMGFALLPDQRASMPFAETSQGHYTLRTNALGLRDDRALVPKKSGVLRVLVVGDSMTFGVGVEREQAFPAVLERALAMSLHSRPVEVVNCGCIAWGQREEIGLLESLGPKLRPDLIVLEFTVANDPLDDLRYLDTEGLVPDPEVADRCARSLWFNNPLARWSRAYLVWDAVRHILRYRMMCNPVILDHACGLVERAHRVAGRLGAVFVVFVAPTLAQVRNTPLQRWLHTSSIDDAVMSSARKNGVVALDALDALRVASAKGESLYFPKDLHWNARGHDIVGNALAPVVATVLGSR